MIREYIGAAKLEKAACMPFTLRYIRRRLARDIAFNSNHDFGYGRADINCIRYTNLRCNCLSTSYLHPIVPRPFRWQTLGPILQTTKKVLRGLLNLYLHQNQRRTSNVDSYWDPKGEVIDRENAPKGKRAANGIDLWEETLLDFYLTEQFRWRHGCGNLASWTGLKMKSTGQTMSKERLHEVSPYNVGLLIEVIASGTTVCGKFVYRRPTTSMPEAHPGTGNHCFMYNAE